MRSHVTREMPAIFILFAAKGGYEEVGELPERARAADTGATSGARCVVHKSLDVFSPPVLSSRVKLEQITPFPISISPPVSPASSIAVSVLLPSFPSVLPFLVTRVLSPLVLSHG